MWHDRIIVSQAIRALKSKKLPGIEGTLQASTEVVNLL